MAEIIVKETEIKVIEVLAQGPAGVQGPPGEPGGDTGRVTMTLTAGAELGGHRVVYADSGFARYGSAADTDTAHRISGITTHAASTFADVQILTSGPIEEVSWDWDTNRPIFCGINGMLTQTIDPSWLFLRVVGYPTGPHSMNVNLQDIIHI